MQAITKRLKRGKRGISTVIVVMLSLVLVVIIVSNVVLWSYQMNQLDWEKIQEKITITNAASTGGTLSFNPSERVLKGSTTDLSGNLTNLESDDGVYMSFRSYNSGIETSDFADNNSSNVDSSDGMGSHSNFAAMQTGPDSVYDVLTEQNTTIGNYGGVSVVTATGSIPNDIDRRNELGYMGAVFFNPTDDIYQVARVEFNATTATPVFNSVRQDEGFSYPISGWAISTGQNVIYWTGTLDVQPHTSQEFFISATANNRDVSFAVYVNIQANSTVYSNSYNSQEYNAAAPWSFLRLGNGTTPQFVTTAAPNTEQTFYVSLEECAGTAINSGGILTIFVPTEFTNIVSNGGSGWGTATVTGNKIEVGNTQNIQNTYITYAFNATAPSTPGLYMLNVSFNGTPNTQVPVGNFSIQVTGSLPVTYQLDLEVQWTNAPYELSNKHLCIFGGTMGSEDIQVDVWDGATWQILFTDITTGWNNISVSSYLTSPTLTIRFRGGTVANDAVQDSWQIDSVLLHAWADEYIAEVEFIGSSNIENWSQLSWAINSALTTSSANVTLQLYNYALGVYPTSGNGYIAYTSSSTPNTDETKSQTIDVNPTDFRNATGYWKIKVKGVKGDFGPFNSNVDFIEFAAGTAGGEGTLLTLKNEGSLTLHIVSLWVNNSTQHQRYDVDIFINSGETAPFPYGTVTLPEKPYSVKVITERGNTAVFASD